MRTYPAPGVCAPCEPQVRSGPCLDVFRIHQGELTVLPGGQTSANLLVSLDDDAEFWLMQVQSGATFAWPSYALLVVNDLGTGYPIFWLQAVTPGAAGDLISLDMHMNPAPGVFVPVVQVVGNAITVLLASAGPASTGSDVIAALVNDAAVAALVVVFPAAGNLVSVAVPDPFGPTNLAGGAAGAGSMLFKLRDYKGNYVQNAGGVGQFVTCPALYFPPGGQIQYEYQNLSDQSISVSPIFLGVKRFYRRDGQ